MTRPSEQAGESGGTPRRLAALASTIHRAVQAVLDRGLQDPRVSGMITVTGVKVAPDLSAATVAVSIYPAEKQDLAMHGLRSAAARVRHDISDALGLRRTPQLTFTLDESLKKQAAVLDAISRASAESAAPRVPGWEPAKESPR